MPAKEVTPEFGFREASPSVAAAALAAIKTGGAATNGRRTRGGSRRGAAPSDGADPARPCRGTTTDPGGRSGRRGTASPQAPRRARPRPSAPG